MEEYRINCPICNDPTKNILEIPDTSVIYHVEGFQAQPNLLWTFRRPTPEAEAGSNLLINRDIMETTELECDNNHYLVTRHCHYGEIDNEANMLYGPSKKPKVKCPKCEYCLGDHSHFIHRIGSSEDMQYILRNITTKSDTAYKQIGAVTRSAVGNYNQVSTVKDCPHCGLTLHFNYSNKVYKDEEKFEGFKSY